MEKKKNIRAYSTEPSKSTHQPEKRPQIRGRSEGSLSSATVKVCSCECERVMEEVIRNSHGKLWVRGDLIGGGSFGWVYLIHSDTKNSEIPAESVVKSALLRDAHSLRVERKVYEALGKSQNVVTFLGHEIIRSESGSFEMIYNLGLEYCSGGSLEDVIEKSRFGLPEATVVKYAKQIIEGILHVHTKGFVHCDIKPSNILLARGSEEGEYVAKLCDFGMAMKMESRSRMRPEIRGTLLYNPPELLVFGEVNWATDVWALGCTVVEMLTGKPLWDGEFKSWEQLYEHICDCPEIAPIPSGISEEAKDFLESCSICQDVDLGYGRWTPKMLLEHPFIKKAESN